MKKLLDIRRRRKNVTQNQEKNQSIETDPERAVMMELEAKGLFKS